MKRIRWGLLATGRMAGKFAECLRLVPEAELAAVGSRDAATARAFASRHGFARHHGSYASLAADPDVDVVYVASPHPGHCEHTLLCLREGKHVLCEKPFAMHARQAQGMIETAAANGLFLMEAMWTRFLPAHVKAREWMRAGAIGELRMLTADFGFPAPFHPEGRLFHPRLGGGALLDVGVYPVAFALALFGPPVDIQATAHIGPTGVDEQTAITLRHAGGQVAALSCAIRAQTMHEATVAGTGGMIHFPAPWWKGQALSLIRPGHVAERVAAPFACWGYQYEIEEVHQCLRTGRRESELLPLQGSLDLIETLDAIRRRIGLRYPADAEEA